MENSQQKLPDFRKTMLLDPKHRYSSNQNFNDLSDWNNNHQIQSSLSLPKVNHFKQQISQITKNINLTSYKSSLLNHQTQRRQQSVLIKPIIIKFNPRALVKSLRRSFIQSQINHKSQVVYFQPVKKVQTSLHKAKIDQIKQPIYLNQLDITKNQIKKYTGVLRYYKKGQLTRKRKKLNQMNQCQFTPNKL